MMKRRCGELGIDRGERDSLPFCERLDLAPSLRNPFVEWKQPAGETNAQIVRSMPLRNPSETSRMRMSIGAERRAGRTSRLPRQPSTPDASPRSAAIRVWRRCGRRQWGCSSRN